MYLSKALNNSGCKHIQRVDIHKNHNMDFLKAFTFADTLLKQNAKNIKKYSAYFCDVLSPGAQNMGA